MWHGPYARESRHGGSMRRRLSCSWREWLGRMPGRSGRALSPGDDVQLTPAWSITGGPRRSYRGYETHPIIWRTPASSLPGRRTHRAGRVPRRRGPLPRPRPEPCRRGTGGAARAYPSLRVWWGTAGAASTTRRIAGERPRRARRTGWRSSRRRRLRRRGIGRRRIAAKPKLGRSPRNRSGPVPGEAIPSSRGNDPPRDKP